MTIVLGTALLALVVDLAVLFGSLRRWLARTESGLLARVDGKGEKVNQPRRGTARPGGGLWNNRVTTTNRLD